MGPRRRSARCSSSRSSASSSGARSGSWPPSPSPSRRCRPNPAIEITDDGAGDRARRPPTAAPAIGLVFYPGREGRRLGVRGQAVGRRRGGHHRRHRPAVAQPRVLRPATAVDVHRPRPRHRRLGGRRPLAGRRAGLHARRPTPGSSSCSPPTARSDISDARSAVLEHRGQRGRAVHPEKIADAPPAAARRRRARRDRGREPLELRRLRAAARRRHPDDLGRGHDRAASPSSSARSRHRSTTGIAHASRCGLPVNATSIERLPGRDRHDGA